MPRADAPTTPAIATQPISRLRFIGCLLRNQLQLAKIECFRNPGFSAQGRASSRLAPKPGFLLAGRCREKDRRHRGPVRCMDDPVRHFALRTEQIPMWDDVANRSVHLESVVDHVRDTEL